MTDIDLNALTPLLIQILTAGGVLVLGVVIGWVLAWVVRRLVLRIAAPLGTGRAFLLGRLASISVIIGVALFALWSVGVPLSGALTWLGATAGVLGVAVGFASQTSAANIISGLFLVGERPFEEGDVISVDGREGFVLSVDLLSVKLRTFDNTYVRVPNESVMKATIVNLTRFPIRRFELILSVRPNVDLDHVRAVMQRVADEIPIVLNEPGPNVLFVALRDGRVDLKVVAWAAKEDFFDAKVRFSTAFVDAVVRDGIALPGQLSEVSVKSVGVGGGEPT